MGVCPRKGHLPTGYSVDGSIPFFVEKDKRVRENQNIPGYFAENQLKFPKSPGTDNKFLIYPVKL
jgi:hypothetical protein